MRVAIVAYDDTHAPAIRSVRTTVFVHEQGVPVELEHDAHDANCRHALIWRNGTPVATGRLDVVAAKIGRVAALAHVRGQGLGRLIMQALEREAQHLGCTQLTLHAQTAVQGFYERLGYHAEGAEFMEANIPHVLMRKAFHAGPA